MQVTRALALVAALAAVAEAAPAAAPVPTPAAARPPELVAQAPFGALGVDDRQAQGAEKLVADAVGDLGTVKLIGSADVIKLVKKAKRPELLVCEGDAKCLGDLATLAGATRIIAGDVGGLGEGTIVYLKAVKAGATAPMSSTTAVLEGKPEERRAAASAAAFRLLAPERYVGALILDIDVKDAEVYLDGRKLRVSSGIPLANLPVGTHALRVTQAQYNDWLRFVDVPFGGAPQRLKVELKAFPIITSEMRGNPLGGPPRKVVTDRLPWYRHWWLPVAAGVIITGAVSTIVYFQKNGVGADQKVTLRPMP